MSTAYQPYAYGSQHSGQQPGYQQYQQPWGNNPQMNPPQQYGMGGQQGQYPPPPPSSTVYDTASTAYSPNGKPPFDNQMNADYGREMTRTPSPTPSELKEMSSGAIDFKAMLNWRFWIRREWILYYIIGAILGILTVLMTVYHEQIVHWLTPVTKIFHDLKFGWLIPIGILFVISFPPLFGHEIVAILCGVVWDLGPAFAIVAAGTLLGEIGNYYAFKYCCRARAEKEEKKKIWYACLAKVTREGGFRIAIMARLSAIPGHFTTAVFATCGMNIFVFIIACIVSLPKQFITVYLGVILKESEDPSKQDPKSKLISDVVLAITGFITIFACWYILRQMNLVKPEVIRARRKARQNKISRQSLSPYGGLADEFAMSETEIPLTATGRQQHNIVLAPKPRPGQPEYNPYGYTKEDELRGTGSDDSHTSDTSDGTIGGKVQYGHALNPSFNPPRSPRERIDNQEVGWNVGGYYNRAKSPMPPGIDQPQQQQQSYQPQQYQQRRTSYQAPPQEPPTFYIPPPGSGGRSPPPPVIHYQPPTDSTSETDERTYPRSPKFQGSVPPTAYGQVPPQAIPAPPQQQQQTSYQPPSHPPPQLQPSQAPQQIAPPETRNPYGHAAEPTGMSYHTAYGSEDSSDGFVNQHGMEPSDATDFVPGAFEGKRY